MADRNSSNRGFASVDPERRHDIASDGGQSVAPGQRSFSRNPALAAKAGRRGGQNGSGGR